MKKRGQLLSQPFIYIFAILLAGLILLFGAMIINKINDTRGELELAKFNSDIKKQVDLYSNLDPGSSKQISLLVPGKAKQICFYNNEYGITSPLTHPDLEVLNLLLKYPQSENLFIIPINAYDNTRFTIPNLKNPSSENPLCIIPKNNKLEVMIETKASQNNIYIEIRRP